MDIISKSATSLILASALFLASAVPAAGTEDPQGASTSSQGVIVCPREGMLDDALRQASSLGLRLRQRLPGGMLLLETRSEIGPLLLEKLPAVRWAEEDLPFRAAATPNDPDYEKQWNLARIGIPQAWDTAGGGDPSVVVAVVDSGIAYRDAGIYTRAPDFETTSFAPGYDFFNGDPYPDDDYGHGTHVAAIIASSYGNSWRGAGIAHGCTVMPVRVLGIDGVGTASMVASGIRYAADNGADVICLSLSSPRHSKAVGEAVRYAYEKGVLCVAAAGNEGSDPGYGGGMGCPADEGNYVLAVGATDHRDLRAHYSNYGTGLDLVAPGGDLTRDDNRDGYADGIPQESYRTSGNCQSGFVLAWGEGTSMAAPQVAAAAVLMLAIAPGLTPGEITDIITGTCADLGSRGWDGEYGSGRLDVPAALSRLTRSAWHFAEGTTRAGFEEWLCVLNPESSEIRVDFAFLTPDGQTQTASCAVPGRSRFSLNVNQVVGPDKDVAVTVTGSGRVYVERAMYFDYGGGWAGGSATVGARFPSTSWYFAEGTTRSGFEEWLTLANPGDAAAKVKVEYLLGAGQGENVDQIWEVSPHSRVTINVNGVVGPEKDVSMHVSSDRAVVAERPMYFVYHGAMSGGDNAMGATAPSTSWYFAEGTTRAGFEEWLTLANPGDAAAKVRVEYMLGAGQGENVAQDLEVPAHARATVNVNQVVGPEKDVSMHVSSDRAMVAERPMYFIYQGVNYQGEVRGGHDAMGATAPSTSWYFAEGTTRSGFEEWLTLANPGDAAAAVKVEYLLGAGQGENVDQIWEVSPHSRVTINVNGVVGPEKDVSMHVSSDREVVAERPMYFSYGPRAWRGGSCVVGYAP